MVRTSASENYLIIGGLGYIGSHLANYIFEHNQDATVTVFDGIYKNADLRRIYSSLKTGSRFALVVGDVANETLLKKTMTDYKIDKIFYCSTSDDTAKYQWNPVGVARNNILGFAHTLEAIRDYNMLKTLVYVSSEEVYGSKTSNKIESVVVRPETSFAASIAGAEVMLHSYFVSYKLPVVIARLSHIVFGGEMNTDNSLISLIAEVDGKYWDKDSRCHSYGLIHIEDAVKGLMCCCDKGKAGEVYNIGGPCDITGQELGRLVVAVNNDTDAGNKSIQLSKSLMSSEKAAVDLGWSSQNSTLNKLILCISEILKPKQKLMMPVDMALNFLIYGPDECIAKLLIKDLNKKGIKWCSSGLNLKTANDEEIFEEIVNVAPSHIIMVAGNDVSEGRVANMDSPGDQSRLRHDTNKYLYIPWLLASICETNGIHFTYLSSSHLYTFDAAHPILGASFREDDLPNYFGDNISVIKGYTDRAMHFFMNTLNARIGMPFGCCKRWMSKTSEYMNIPISVTVLPSCLPILIELAIKRVCGTINLVNSGSISLSEIAAKYKKIVDSDFHYKTVNYEECIECLSEQAFCTLDSSKLQNICPTLKSADVELTNYFTVLSNRKNRSMLQKA